LFDGSYTTHFQEAAWKFISKFGHRFKQLDIVISHPDFDHYNGITSLLQTRHESLLLPCALGTIFFNAPVDARLLEKGNPKLVELCSSIEKLCDLKQIQWKRTVIQHTTIAPRKVHAIWPSKSMRDKLTEAWGKEYNKNSASIVSLISIPKDHPALITGDAESDNIIEALEDEKTIECVNGIYYFSYFEVPHHGSQGNYKKVGLTNFYSKICSRVYYISGSGRTYNHPDQITVETIINSIVKRKTHATIIVARDWDNEQGSVVKQRAEDHQKYVTYMTGSHFKVSLGKTRTGVDAFTF